MAVVRTCSLVLVAALVARTAHADPPLEKPKQAAALDHLEQASKLYNVRAFDKAAEEYKAGALIEAAPIFDYNLAQCYRQLHRYEDAIWHYQRFIHESPQTPEHVEAAQKFITEMKAELDQKAMTEPPTESAEVATERPEHAIDPQPTGRHVDTTPPSAPSSDAWYDDPVGWGLAGAGLVGLGVSGALFVSASGLNDDADRATTQTEAKQIRDRADTRSLLGTMVGIGGAALLIGGVVKLAIHPSSEPSTASALNVGLSSNGLVVFARF